MTTANYRDSAKTRPDGSCPTCGQSPDRPYRRNHRGDPEGCMGRVHEGRVYDTFERDHRKAFNAYLRAIPASWNH